MIISLFLMIDWAPFHLKVLIFYHSELPGKKHFLFVNPHYYGDMPLLPHTSSPVLKRGGGEERERERDGHWLSE